MQNFDMVKPGNQLAFYALKVRGGREEQAKSAIVASFKANQLGDCLGAIHMPSQSIYKIQKGKRVISKRYFAYIVIETDVQRVGVKELLLEIPEVLGFFSEKGWGRRQEPMALEAEEVENMLGNKAKSGIEDDSTLLVKVGEKVSIAEGALQGKIATVVKVHSLQKKIEATIQLFGKATKTSLSYTQIQKII